MLVYKTTEKKNETKFYGVQNDEWFAQDLLESYENAENAGLINAEFTDNERNKKLINLTLENINTMRQAFEVYSIINNQSLKDTRKDFRIEIEDYCDDDKPETFYRVATLDDFKEVMFDEYNLGIMYWREASNLVDWLKDNVNGFEFNSITGYSQGEGAIFYKFGSNDDEYLPLDNETLMTVYGGAVDIEELEKDEQGHLVLDDDGDMLEMVPELYVDEQGYTDNEYVDKYMKEHYNAVPAEKEVTYF